jgi:hypothetical protein
MARPTGTLKTGGRQKGSLNKSTLMLRESLDLLKLNVPEKLAELIPQLPIEKQADVLLKIMPYLYPQLKHSEFVADSILNNTQDVESAPQSSLANLSSEEKIKILEVALRQEKRRLAPTTSEL